MEENGLKYESINYDEIIEIHNKAIEFGGGAHGMVSHGNLDFIVNHVKIHEYKGTKQDRLLSKAAYLLHRIVTGHPFTDGNKRTAHLVTLLFLEENGVIITVKEQEVIDFLLELAKHEHSVSHVKKWLKTKIKKASMK